MSLYSHLCGFISGNPHPTDAGQLSFLSPANDSVELKAQDMVKLQSHNVNAKHALVVKGSLRSEKYGVISRNLCQKPPAYRTVDRSDDCSFV